MKEIKVTHEDKSMTILLPVTGDKGYDQALEEAQREKTVEQLKKRPAKPVSKTSKADVSGALREWNEFNNRQKRGEGKKYY